MPPTDYDAIVIGSGAGGSAAAWKLASAGLRTVLLERGASLPKDGSTLDAHRVVTQGEFLSREPWVDGAGQPLTPEEHFNVGGKTKWYGAALLRFSASEFQAAAAHACRAWPIGLPDLEPYYREAEQLLQVRQFDVEPDLQRILKRIATAKSPWRIAPLPMALAAEIMQHPPEAAHFDGFASVLGLKHEAEASLLARLSGGENFSLLTNAEVIALLGADDDATEITGVRLRDGRELRAPQVVLACGALHSPRLLARYLAARGLDASLPAAQSVGRNLKMHRLTALVAVSTHRIDDLLRKTRLLTHDRFAHSDVQPLGFDAELLANLMPKLLPSALRRLIGRHAYGFFLQTEDGSDARNRVIDNGHGMPPTLDYSEERLPASLQEHLEFTAAFRAALLRAGLLGFSRRVGPGGTAHACGTLVCGHDASDSVVDAHGRVHGLHGLSVADGSVLPRSSRVNPALTIYAWGLRVGERIARDALVHP